MLGGDGRREVSRAGSILSDVGFLSTPLVPPVPKLDGERVGKDHCSKEPRRRLNEVAVLYVLGISVHPD